VPQLQGGCDNAEEDATWLRQNCGPNGADKLAHCYGFCMVERCTGLGWALYWDQLDEESDPLDLYADRLGIQCAHKKVTGDVSRDCLGCCTAATYDIPYHI
jgi:hypothetical protein